MKLSENIDINIYTIMLIEEKRQPYEHIYTFNLEKLITLEAYIKTYVKTRFI